MWCNLKFPDKFSSENEVTLTNLQIEGCELENDNGIIQMATNSVLSIEESNFENNINTKNSSIIIMEEGSVLTLKNSLFDQNVILSESTGLIRSGKSCNIRIGGSVVNNNIGESSLIIIDEMTSITIEDSTFTNNTISAYGAVLIANMSHIENPKETNINITDSYFIENTVNENMGGVLAIIGQNVNCEISDSAFLRNKASSEGGALFALEGPNISISGSVFIENTSLEGGGGAIYAQVTLNY